MADKVNRLRSQQEEMRNNNKKLLQVQKPLPTKLIANKTQMILFTLAGLFFKSHLKPSFFFQLENNDMLLQSYLLK